jgi:hypothetical protein
MDFLPDDYEPPKNNTNYFKIQDGDNKLRILSKPILGWQDWGADNKPIRYKMDNKPLKPRDVKKPIQHFWSFIVWDYSDNKIKIMHITQQTIRNMILNLTKNDEWGNPSFYDITINKKGSQQKTEYTVAPSPKKPLSIEMLRAFKDTPINLNALFENGDPFTQLDEITSGMFVEEPVVKNNFITENQHKELILILAECEPSFEKDLKEKISKSDVDFKDWKTLKTIMYEKVKATALKNREDYNNKPFDIF